MNKSVRTRNSVLL